MNKKMNVTKSVRFNRDQLKMIDRYIEHVEDRTKMTLTQAQAIRVLAMIGLEYALDNAKKKS